MVGAPRLRVATRGSPLARAQAARVVERLGVDADLVVVATRGDVDRESPVHSLGGTGVFVKEVQAAVLDGRADLAVHSAKDLPSVDADGLMLAAVPERGDPRDALVGSTLEDLPTGATVATGSVRRRAQLAAARPDLGFAELRGNIETRLAKAADFDAIVLAAVALERLDLVERITERIDLSVMLPQVGQGALAVECRADDDVTLALVAAIDDPGAHRAVDAERAFLAEIGGGCSLPVGALACVDEGDVKVVDHGDVKVEVLLTSLDGRVVLRASATDPDPMTAGRAAASALLDERGGRLLLEDLT